LLPDCGVNGEHAYRVNSRRGGPEESFVPSKFMGPFAPFFVCFGNGRVTQHTFRASSEPDNSSAASHDSRRPDGFVSKALISKLLPSIAEIYVKKHSVQTLFNAGEGEDVWRAHGQEARRATTNWFVSNVIAIAVAKD